MVTTARRSVAFRPGPITAIALLLAASALLLGCAGNGAPEFTSERLVPAISTESAVDAPAEQIPEDSGSGDAKDNGGPGSPGVAPEGAMAEGAPGGAAASNDPCPDALPGTFVHAEERFCLRVPDGFLVQTPMPGRTVFVSAEPAADGGPSAQLLVTEEGAAGGRSTAEFAQERTAQIISAGVDLQLGSIVLAGAQAVTAEAVPGVAPARQAYLVHEDRVYILTLLPVDPDRPETSGAAERLWRVAVDSFSFR